MKFKKHVSIDELFDVDCYGANEGCNTVSGCDCNLVSGCGCSEINDGGGAEQMSLDLGCM